MTISRVDDRTMVKFVDENGLLQGYVYHFSNGHCTDRLHYIDNVCVGLQLKWYTGTDTLYMAYIYARGCMTGEAIMFNRDGSIHSHNVWDDDDNTICNLDGFPSKEDKFELTLKHGNIDWLPENTLDIKPPKNRTDIHGPL